MTKIYPKGGKHLHHDAASRGKNRNPQLHCCENLSNREGFSWSLTSACFTGICCGSNKRALGNVLHEDLILFSSVAGQ